MSLEDLWIFPEKAIETFWPENVGLGLKARPDERGEFALAGRCKFAGSREDIAIGRELIDRRSLALHRGDQLARGRTLVVLGLQYYVCAGLCMPAVDAAIGSYTEGFETDLFLSPNKIANKILEICG